MQAKCQDVEYLPKKTYRTQYFDFKQGSYLLKFLQTVPNLDQIKFKLSSQEEQVVSETNNLIVIGRSGTGKTTCALMRLFAIELLFKNKEAKKQQAKSSLDNRNKTSYLHQVHGLKNVFLTASPFLISEIHNKYTELVEHVMNEIENKQKREKLQWTNQDLISEKLDQAEARFHELQAINQIEERIRDRDEMLNCLEDIQEHEFPGFFTTKLFTIMVDGSLANPFFLRDAQRKRIRQNMLFREKDNKHTEFLVRRKGNDCYALQCDYDYFQKEFWPHINLKEISKRYNYQKVNKGKCKQITCIVVWTEIISVIKGHCIAYTLPDRCLSLDQYLAQSRNQFYGQIEKKIIYDCFIFYQQLKQRGYFKAYDFMDLVNHVLYESEAEFYQNIPNSFGFLRKIQPQAARLHYLFLDQVQDLPPAQIYLISRLFNDGFYFSGDTAQAIQKGVSFRFADLNSMFHPTFQRFKLPFSMPSRHQLTFNFRSHNQILQFANTIVQVIEKLFPKSIDSLKKEESDLQGPKPYVLSTADAKQLCELLLEEGKGSFGSNQAIIVRDELSKQSLPSYLKDLSGMVLTVEQAKGWQFSDVVCYNFFPEKLVHKWKVLKYLDIYPRRGSREFKLQEIAPSEYDCLIIQLKMFYTLITRAKCTLILVEPFLPEEFVHIWQQKDLLSRDSLQLKKQIVCFKQKVVAQKYKDSSWQQRGFMFYQQKNYKQAYECYERAGLKKVCLKIQAVQLRQKADNQLHREELLHNLRYQLYDTGIQRNTDEAYNTLLKQLKKIVFPLYRQSAGIFQGIGMYQSAGNCYFMSQNYAQSYACFLRCQGKILQRAICQQNLHMHEQAAINFASIGQHKRMIYNIEQVNSTRRQWQILQGSGQFKEREYYFRKYYHSYCCTMYEQMEQSSKKKEWFIGQSRSQSTFEQLLGMISWESLLYQIKKKLSYIVKIKANDKQHYQILSQFYKQCHQNQLFSTERQIAQKTAKAQQLQGYLKNQIVAYPTLYYYPTDQSMFKELAAELQLIQTQEELLTLQEKLIAARKKQTQLYQPISTRLRKALQSSRYLSRQILSPLSQLTPDLFTKFLLDLQKYQMKLLKEKQPRIQLRLTDFKLSINKVKESIQEYYNYFDIIERIATKEELYRNRDRLNFKQKLNNIFEEFYNIVRTFFEDNINHLKNYLLTKAFIDSHVDRKCTSIKQAKIKAEQDLFELFGFANNERTNQISAEIYQKCQITDLFGTMYEISQHNSKIPSKIKKQLLLKQPIDSHKRREQMHSHDYLVNVVTVSDIYPNRLSVLEKVELVSPITAAGQFYKLNQFHRCLSNILCHFAMKSYPYLRSTSISSHSEQMPNLGINLSSINPEIFKFRAQVTRFRAVEGTRQFLEGLMLLGFWQDVVQIADSNFSACLQAMYLNTAAVVRVIEEHNSVIGLQFNLSSEKIDQSKEISLNSLPDMKSLSLVAQTLLLATLSGCKVINLNLESFLSEVTQNVQAIDKILEQMSVNYSCDNLDYFVNECHMDKLLVDFFLAKDIIQLPSFLTIKGSIHQLLSQEATYLCIAYACYLFVPGLRQKYLKMTQRQTLLQKIQQLEKILQAPLANEKNFQYLVKFMNLFGANVIHQQNNMQWLQNFVVVRQDSIILKYLHNNNHFCFYIDQRKTRVVMKFIDVLNILIGKICKKDLNLNLKEADTYLATFYLCFKPEQEGLSQLSIEKSVCNQLITQIQQSRTQLLEFYYRTQFISHQSFSFVWYQLKAYSDYLHIIRQSKFNPLAMELVKDEGRYLNDHFNRWKVYANTFEIDRVL